MPGFANKAAAYLEQEKAAPTRAGRGGGYGLILGLPKKNPKGWEVGSGAAGCARGRRKEGGSGLSSLKVRGGGGKNASRKENFFGLLREKAKSGKGGGNHMVRAINQYKLRANRSRPDGGKKAENKDLRYQINKETNSF